MTFAASATLIDDAKNTPFFKIFLYIYSSNFKVFLSDAEIIFVISSNL